MAGSGSDGDGGANGATGEAVAMEPRARSAGDETCCGGDGARGRARGGDGEACRGNDKIRD